MFCLASAIRFGLFKGEMSGHNIFSNSGIFHSIAVWIYYIRRGRIPKWRDTAEKWAVNAEKEEPSDRDWQKYSYNSNEIVWHCVCMRYINYRAQYDTQAYNEIQYKSLDTKLENEDVENERGDDKTRIKKIWKTQKNAISRENCFHFQLHSSLWLCAPHYTMWCGWMHECMRYIDSVRRKPETYVFDEVVFGAWCVNTASQRRIVLECIRMRIWDENRSSRMLFGPHQDWKNYFRKI